MKNKPAALLIVCVWGLAAGIGWPVRALAANQTIETIYQKNSLYNSIYVYKDQSIVTLQFGKQFADHVQSRVNMEDLHQHMLEYSEMTFCGLLYQPQPQKMLVLGLGGGVIPREMRYYFPNLQIDVAEIDPDIPPVAEKFLGFKEDENLKVYVDDGRMFIKKQLRRQPAVQYDIIVLDAFNGDYIPFHLMTKEFLEEVKGVLAPDGVVVANVFFTNRLFDAELKTFIAVFGRSQAYFGVHSGNAMLVSPNSQGRILSAHEAKVQAEQLAKKIPFTFDMPQVAAMLRPDTQPEAAAKILTDDLAPVNWLRQQKKNK